jgi:hypothetical protein
MRKHILTATLVAALTAPALPAFAQAANASLGSVTLTRKVMADGKPLAAGTYQVRLTGENAKPAVGQSPDGETYVEFVRGGQVIAKEVATKITSADIAAIAKWRKPMANGVRVETLKGNDYVRVWIARQGTHYLINLPAGA